MLPQTKSSTRAPRQKTNERVLRPVHANAGIEAAYRKRLDALIKEMADSVEYWLTASYRANEPLVAQDETPAEALRRSIRNLAKRWLKRFDEAAPKLAAWFSQATNKRSSATLRKILIDSGYAIEFKMTPPMRDVIDATVNANVALIKSIPQQYLTQVEGMVMRSVQAGGDLKQLTDDLRRQYGVTRRRAALIARDQNNKATSAMTRARQIEAGIEEAIWVHTIGGHNWRPTHVKASKEKTRYRIAEGWFDPAVGKHIHPGELVACKCVGRPIVKGFS